MSEKELVKPLSCIFDKTKEQEITVKQIYAYYFKSWGYDVPLSLKEIAKNSNFCGSIENLEPADVDSIKISDNTRACYGKVRKEMLYLDNLDDASSEETLDEKKPDLKKRDSKSSHHFHHHQHQKVDHEHVHGHLQHFNPEDLQESFWTVARNNTLDISLLRFIIARRYVTNDALNMSAKCLDWRKNLHPCNKWLLAGDAEVYWEGKHPKLIEAYKLNQAYLRGKDKKGNPIVVIRVQKHLRKNCPDHDFERLICSVIEWIILDTKYYQEGVLKGCCLFDMTNFSMKNADLAAVHFLAVMFEANYPECLGNIWIHNAPWIFNAVWKIIKPWLDPDVASKIIFTKGVKELSQHIDMQYIPKSLGGDDTHENEYIIPTQENAGRKPKDSAFKQATIERDELCMKFVESTLDWIKAKTPEESGKCERLRSQVQFDLVQNYLKIDPYIRTRSLFERCGTMSELGY